MRSVSNIISILEHLPADALALCQTLASCACRRVPAFLFIRPWLSRRQWDLEGTIEEKHLSSDKVPRWAKLIFSTEIGGDWYYPRTNLVGLPPGFLQSKSIHGLRISNNIRALIRQDILRTYTEDGWLYFELTDPWQEILHQDLHEDGRMNCLAGLAALVIQSYPAPYLEPLWQSVQEQCAQLIDSTIHPFLSVLEWRCFGEYSLE